VPGSRLPAPGSRPLAPGPWLLSDSSPRKPAVDTDAATDETGSVGHRRRGPTTTVPEERTRVGHARSDLPPVGTRQRSATPGPSPVLQGRRRAGAPTLAPSAIRHPPSAIRHPTPDARRPTPDARRKALFPGAAIEGVRPESCQLPAARLPTSSRSFQPPDVSATRAAVPSNRVSRIANRGRAQRRGRLPLRLERVQGRDVDLDA
jgi:hypothetical protein